MVSVYVKNDILNDENENCVSCQNEWGLHFNCDCGICGDGILTSSEECDDGNNIDRDGCSQCKID